jgi:hypothetical protein
MYVDVDPRADHLSDEDDIVMGGAGTLRTYVCVCILSTCVYVCILNTYVLYAIQYIYSSFS